jgi:MSHA biogenesis protein MshO
MISSSQRQSGGFTFVELVVTILVGAIMTTGIIRYIADSVDGFAATSARNKLASSGRTVVDRLALELHNAVPNSIRVSAVSPGGDQCLEFVPFIAATSYLTAPFTGSGAAQFDVIDFNPSLIVGPGAGLYAVIYPINTQALYLGGSPGPIALIDEISDPNILDGRVRIALDASHRFSRRSPVERVYIAETPVSFCVVGGLLFRYQGYGFLSVQPSPALLPSAAPGRALISNRLDSVGVTAFSILEPTLRRNAIVSLEFNFVDLEDTVRLKHEVLIRNVP